MIQLPSSRCGTALVIRASGRIDAVTAPDFERACLELVRAGEKLVVIDFGEVRYISSAGLRSLLVIGKALQDSRGVLRFANVSGVVGQVFELSGIFSLFPRFTSTEEASHFEA